MKTLLKKLLNWIEVQICMWATKEKKSKAINEPEYYECILGTKRFRYPNPNYTKPYTSYEPQPILRQEYLNQNKSL